MKLLIADDDPRFRKLLRQSVAGVASSVWEASDGTEAIANYEAHRPDWVLMDLRMKPMNGLTATREIKARFPEARVVIITQYDDLGLRAATAEAGALAYILKEDLGVLRQTLRISAQP